MTHVYRYISALTVLLILFSTYALAVVPWLEPPPIVRHVNSDPGPAQPRTAGMESKYAQFFPPNHWVHDNPKIIETEQCALLIRDYKPEPDGRLVLEPCALVFHQHGDGKSSGESQPNAARPIFLEAPRAELTFDRPLDFARAEFGRLEKGTLSGEITIWMPPSVPGARDELRLRTRALWLDRESIRTSNEVEFQYGDSSGRGRILEIALGGPAADPAQRKKAKFGSVQTVTLKHLDYLHIATAGQSLIGNATPAREPAAAADAAPLEVKCQGEVTFDLAAQLARFERQVRVMRLNVNAPPDQLDCEELLLSFTENGPAKGTNPNAQLAGRLKRIVAIGAPAVLKAPTNGVEAVAAFMEYSLADRAVTLKSDKSQNVPQVTLCRNEQQFVAPDLHYQMADEGRLGRLHASGPGELHVVDAENRRTVSAHWQRQVQIQPQESNHVISLLGSAGVAIDPLGRFAGDELHLWVQESRPTVAVGQAPPETASNAKQGRSEQAAYNLAPNRLLAIGNVRVVSPQLDVDTGRLEAWFINLPAEPAQMRPLAPPPTIREPVQRVAFTTDAAPRGSIRNVVRQPTLQKFHVAGSKIQMQALLRGQTFDLEDLVIDGQAQIDEVHTPEPNQEPLRLRADLLKLLQGTKPDTIIELTGLPAEVRGRGISIAAGKIVVHRGKNEIRIDGPGEATMPGPETGIGSQGSGVGNLGSSGGGPMHLVWQQGLIFDGQIAHFTGDVQVRTATQTASAPILEATLSQRINFQTQGGQQAELASLFLDGRERGVFMVNRGHDEYGQQISQEQMRVRNLLVDRIGGKLRAEGPGWVSTVRRGNAALPGGPGLPQPVQPPPPQAAGQQLTSIHVAFEREIVGDLTKRQIEFRQQVQTTYSPASDFADVIAADPLSELREGMVLIESDSLLITEFVRPDKRWFELEIKGRTKVRGVKADVDAPIISYSSANEVLSLRGEGRARAKIWMSPGNGQQPGWVELDEIRYNVRTCEMKSDGIRNIRFPFDPGFNLPGPTK